MAQHPPAPASNARSVQEFGEGNYGRTETAIRTLLAEAMGPAAEARALNTPLYSDVLYVSELIGPDVVNTMPEETLRAFADHGEVARTVDANPDRARHTLADARAAGIDLEAVTAELRG